MRIFSADELDRMRQTQRSSMMDWCELLQPAAGAVDAYGKSYEHWVWFATVSCGFEATQIDEVMSGAEVSTETARLRLPIGIYIGPTQPNNVEARWRVRVTHRHGELLAEPLMYEVMGEVARGASGVVVNLRRVTDGTNA